MIGVEGCDVMSGHDRMILVRLVTNLRIVVGGHSLQMQVFADGSLVWRCVVLSGASPNRRREYSED